MLNKKALGLHWYVLLISFFITIGILMYYDATKSTIKVGEFSMGISKAIERNSNVPEIIENIMEEINEQTAANFDQHAVFQYESYCEDWYKDSISDRTFKTKTPPYERIYCHSDENNLIDYFERIFNNEYSKFRVQKSFGKTDLDFSNVIYRFNVEKENDAYFNTVGINNKLVIPINLEGKQVGKFYMEPSFKFPVDYRFDQVPEICIFAAKCASCEDFDQRYQNDVEFQNRYPGLDYKIKREPCVYYDYGCDVIRDEFDTIFEICDVGEDRDKEYLCSGICNPPDCTLDDESKADKYPTNCLSTTCDSYYSCFIADCICSAGAACAGDCIPYCEPATGKVDDGDDNTNCRQFSCSNYYNCKQVDPSDKCGCDSLFNACEAIDGGEEACPTCWCSGWDYDDECGKAECGETEVLKTRTCMPAGCDIERECEYSTACDCSLDGVDNTECLDNSCSSYDSCTAASSCGCLTGNACKGIGGELCRPYCDNPPTGKIEDGKEDTKCVANDCDDYDACGFVADGSCVCSGILNACKSTAAGGCILLKCDKDGKDETICKENICTDYEDCTEATGRDVCACESGFNACKKLSGDAGACTTPDRTH